MPSKNTSDCSIRFSKHEHQSVEVGSSRLMTSTLNLELLICHLDRVDGKNFRTFQFRNQRSTQQEEEYVRTYLPDRRRRRKTERRTCRTKRTAARGAGSTLA